MRPSSCCWLVLKTTIRWKSMCVLCVCVCVCVCVRVRVCVWAHAKERERERLCVCVMQNALQCHCFVHSWQFTWHCFTSSIYFLPVEEAGGKALPCIVDIRIEEQVEAAVKETVKKFGGIDILVNNASAISLTGTLQTPMKRYDLMNGINARGTYLWSVVTLLMVKWWFCAFYFSYTQYRLFIYSTLNMNIWGERWSVQCQTT